MDKSTPELVCMNISVYYVLFDSLKPYWGNISL